MKSLFTLVPFIAVCSLWGNPYLFPHDELKTFELNRNTLTGVCTKPMGPETIEVWHSSLTPGSCTPLHIHDTEEIFIFLKGKGHSRIGDMEFDWEAPCTIITPANEWHQHWNTGDEPTEQLAIMPLDSEIRNAKEEVMNLPWRTFIPPSLKESN